MLHLPIRRGVVVTNELKQGTALHLAERFVVLALPAPVGFICRAIGLRLEMLGVGASE